MPRVNHPHQSPYTSWSIRLGQSVDTEGVTRSDPPMKCDDQPTLRLWAVGVVLLVAVLVGCRTMPAEDRPFTHTRTYHAAMVVDPEPHVLNVTVHAPSRSLDYSSPRRLHLSMLSGMLLQCRDAEMAKLCDRTLGVHSVGHVMIELKSTDPTTGQVRYLLTALNAADPGEWGEQAAKQKVGYAIFTRGVAGKIDTPDRVATDLEEPAEVGRPSARLRVLLSPEAADRMFRFYAEFLARGGDRRLALVSDPLAGDGASCASLAAAFLEVGGLFDPEWQAAWQRTLRVPEALVGDPEAGKKVKLWRLFVGPTVRRWAEPHEPHRDITYFDTTLMHAWIVQHAAHSSAVECQLERLLALPVATVDGRFVPTPTGPISPR